MERDLKVFLCTLCTETVPTNYITVEICALLGWDRTLSRNVGNKLTFYSEKNPKKRAQISFHSRSLKSRIRHCCKFLFPLTLLK